MVSMTFEFYDLRARTAEAEADKAVLDNVRERELRSANAWRNMADRQLVIDAERIKSDAARIVRRAEEAAALARTADAAERPAERQWPSPGTCAAGSS